MATTALVLEKEEIALVIALYVTHTDLFGHAYIKKTGIARCYGTVARNQQNHETIGFTSNKKTLYGPMYTPDVIVNRINADGHAYYWYDDERILIEEDIVDKIVKKFNKSGKRILLVKGNGTQRPDILKYYDGKKFVDWIDE
jgi:hypothetical protein